MQVQNLISVRQREKHLEQQREKKIQYRLMVKQRNQLAEGRDKKATTTKTRRIKKKTFETKKEKIRKPKPQLQSNVRVTTFVNESKEYIRYYNRTKGYIQFNNTDVIQKIEMLRTLREGERKNSPLLSIEVIFERDIDPVIRPCQAKLPHPRKILNIIIVVDKVSQIKENLKDWNYQSNVEAFTLSEFRGKLNDPKFLAKALQASTLLFSDFGCFKELSSLPIYDKISAKNTVFPIDCNHVPFNLRHQFPTYESYLDSLCGYSYFTTKPGKEFLFHIGDLKALSDQENAQNVCEGTLMIVARLFEKNKLKNNAVIKVNLRTPFSIPVEIYSQ